MQVAELLRERVVAPVAQVVAVGGERFLNLVRPSRIIFEEEIRIDTHHAFWPEQDHYRFYMRANQPDVLFFEQAHYYRNPFEPYQFRTGKLHLDSTWDYHSNETPPSIHLLDNYARQPCSELSFIRGVSAKRVEGILLAAKILAGLSTVRPASNVERFMRPTGIAAILAKRRPLDIRDGSNVHKLPWRRHQLHN